MKRGGGHEGEKSKEFMVKYICAFCAEKNDFSLYVRNGSSLGHFWVILFVVRGDLTRFPHTDHPSFRGRLFHFSRHRRRDGRHVEVAVWRELCHQLRDYPRHTEEWELPHHLESLRGATQPKTGMEREELAWVQ